MKSRDILTAQLGQKVTCLWPPVVLYSLLGLGNTYDIIVSRKAREVQCHTVASQPRPGNDFIFSVFALGLFTSFTQLRWVSEGLGHSTTLYILYII